MKPVRERFWAKVDRSGSCWIWTAAVSRGYGSFNDASLPTHRAHRIAYLMEVGPIPDGVDVCHTCDNRLCVRPDHLWLGSRADNMADMVAKGRYVVGRRYAGERNSQSVLTWEQVREIRHRASCGSTLRELARQYPVSRPAIARIVNGLAWKEDTE